MKKALNTLESAATAEHHPLCCGAQAEALAKRIASAESFVSRLDRLAGEVADLCGPGYEANALRGRLLAAQDYLGGLMAEQDYLDHHHHEAQEE